MLATSLRPYAQRPDVVIFALPRGGVPVAYEVALQLRAPLDVFVVRKLGVPGHEELAMGAIASNGVQVLNEETIRAFALTDAEIAEVARIERREVERRESDYRAGRPPIEATGETVILIDDGLATGSSMRAAIQALRRLNPASVIAAVPVAAPDTCSEMASEADDMVCAVTPEPFIAVGVWYEDFSQTTDKEVRELLSRAAREIPRRNAHAASPYPTGM